MTEAVIGAAVGASASILAQYLAKKYKKGEKDAESAVRNLAVELMARIAERNATRPEEIIDVLKEGFVKIHRDETIFPHLYHEHTVTVKVGKKEEEKKVNSAKMRTR